jgi:two-component system sensor histidine kinase CpxA
MLLPKLNSLYGRIFAIFWVTILIVLFSVLSLPHFDPRKAQTLSEETLDELKAIKESIEQKFAGENRLQTILMHLPIYRIPGPNQRPVVDLQPRERVTNNRPREPRMGLGGPRTAPRPWSNRIHVFITDLEGNILSTKQYPGVNLPNLKNFITSIESHDQPKQRLYGHYMIAGPLPIKLAHQKLLLYTGRRGIPPPPFVIRLLDNPITFLLAVMITSTPFLLWLAWALSQPAQKLAQAAQRVARGEFQVDHTLEQGTSEFRQAGHSFNQMVEAVNGMISGQQRLLSDISHELRSPLTRLRMANALASRKLGNSTELERIDTEAQRLEQMIGELLELSRTQVNSHTSREIQPLTSLWEPLLEDAQFEAEHMSKTLVYTPVPDRMISGTPKLLMSALENIIRNAIHYGRDQIRIGFTEQPHQVIITVEDNGDGVPEQELKDIFRPFYRVSTARDRHSGGTGLGLAITESAVRQHNGQIEASRSEIGGLKITMILPLNV